MPISAYSNTMAKMHSRARGRARSKKPLKKKKNVWLRYKAKEIELLIVKLAKEGNSSSKIGLILRDAYGIPDVHYLIKKKITQILAENKLLSEIPEDLISLIKKQKLIKKHLEKNKQDKSSLRGLQLTESKIHRLTKYYKRIKKIPENWTLEAAKLGIS